MIELKYPNCFVCYRDWSPVFDQIENGADYRSVYCDSHKDGSDVFYSQYEDRSYEIMRQILIGDILLDVVWDCHCLKEKCKGKSFISLLKDDLADISETKLKYFQVSELPIDASNSQIYQMVEKLILLV